MDIELNERIKFRSKSERRRFFLELSLRTNSTTLRELTEKLALPYGCLKMYWRGERTMPAMLVKKWADEFSINIDDFGYKKTSISDILRVASKKGINKLRKKYGRNLHSVLGKKGKIKLDELTRRNKNIEIKRRILAKAALTKKYGENPYREIGRLGGRNSIAKLSESQLQKRLEKIFRKSFRKKISFDEKQYRSLKEIELAKFLTEKRINFIYEKKVTRYYPDFLIPNKNLIIEVVGFDWEPHIKRTKEKVHVFTGIGYNVVIYTYKNLLDKFSDLPITVTADLADLEKIIGRGLKTGECSA